MEKRETGSDGKLETRRESRPRATLPVRSRRCVIEDATGSVAVDFDGAKVEAAQVHRRSESPVSAVADGGLIGVGTLGYRYTEWVVAADVPVYLLGTVLPAAGSANRLKKQPFVVCISRRGRGVRPFAMLSRVLRRSCGIAALPTPPFNAPGP